MRFEYELVPGWAPLSWIAFCGRGAETITAFHGPDVETRPEWFCEAVWPGPFELGDFDRTDLVFGSGGRLRDTRATFVSSGTTLDRLLSLQVARGVWVSNSLALLLAMSEARIDISYPHYIEDFGTIRSGIRDYKNSLATSKGNVRITVFDALEWNGTDLVGQSKSSFQRDFSCFESYDEFLRGTFRELALNIADAGRTRTYSFLSTVSSGYDSPAITALAREVGCQDSVTIDRDRFGNEEHGDRVASQLGMNCVVIPRLGWRSLPHAEIPFLAAAGDAEAVFLASIESELRGRVLLTGYHGDKMWGKHVHDLSENVVRGDSSGTSLTEFRLWAGCINCSPPFWGVRQIADVNRISNLPSMSEWDVPGDYSRPVPRRIAERAGVARELFGVRKRASAVGLSEFLTPASRQAYAEWLSRNRLAWLANVRVPPIQNEAYERFSASAHGVFDSWLRRTPMLWRVARDNSVEWPTRFRRFAFAWALSETCERYRRSRPYRAHELAA